MSEENIRIEETRRDDLDIDEATRGGKDSGQEQGESKTPTRDEVEGIGFPMKHLSAVADLSPSRLDRVLQLIGDWYRRDPDV